MSWSYDGRKMNLAYPEEAISYVRVSEKDAVNIGLFMLGFGTFLIVLSITSIGAIVEHGKFTEVPFSCGVEALTIPVFLVAFLSFFLAPRAAVALCSMAVGFIVAVDVGRDTFTALGDGGLLLVFGVWYGALALSFLLLWPYPMWPGLLLAYFFGGCAPILLLIGTITPGNDIGWVILASLIAVFVTVFGLALRGLSVSQRDLEDSHYIRYGD